MEAQVKERREAGLALDGLPDLADDGVLEGQYQALLIHSLAARHITAWSGIEDDPPVSRENVAALMDLYPVGERFIQEFTLRQVLLTSAKNASGPSADGTSSQAVGPDTANPVRKRARPAQKAASGLNGEPCPYQKHAPVALEEHQAWEVFTASLGQLRVAPSGRVLGVDMTAALGTARARGFDEAVVSELLQAAEAGLIEAMNDKDSD